MKIHIENSKPVRKSFFRRKGLIFKLFKAMLLAVALLLMFVLGVYFAMKTHSSGSAKTLLARLAQLRETRLAVIPNYINGLKATPETITIDIKHENFMKLQYFRDKALEKRLLINTDDSYVSADMHYNSKTLQNRNSSQR